MAKDDAADPPSKRLRQFRKLFNDYTNKDVKKPPSGRRSASSSSPTESPLPSPQKRSAARAPRSRYTAKNRAGESSPASPSTPEKDPDRAKVPEAKELNKADDEEFENADVNLAKCKMKTRDLQWLGEGEDKPDVTVDGKNAYKSMDNNGLRRKKSRSATKKPRSVGRRKKTAGSSNSPVSPAAPNPSAEVLRSSASAESCNDDLPEIDQTSKDFKQAMKLMGILKRGNLLENALFPAQNEEVKTFFEGGMRNVDNKMLGLISKAMDFVLDAVFFRGEDLDCMIDNDLKKFIVDRTKSKPLLLDVLITRPEFLPLSWGGRTVVLRAAASEVSVNMEVKREEKR